MLRRAVAMVLSAIAGGPALLVAQLSSTSELPPILVRGAPRSFQVVEIPAPKMNDSGHEGRFEIRTMDGFTIIGPKSGVVPDGGRSLLATLAVPAAARAGRVRAAVIRFTGGAGSVLTRTVEVDVSRVRAVMLQSAAARLGALAGDRVSLAYSVANDGNAADTVLLRVTVPQGWRATAAEPVVLAPGAVVEGKVEVSLPVTASRGLAMVRLLALAGRDTVTSASVPVEVVDSRGGGGSVGPELTVGSAMVQLPDETVEVMHSFSLDGSITDDIRVTGRATVAADAGTPGPLGTTYSTQAPSLALTAQTWRLQLGAAGMVLPELAGAGVGGRGVGLEMERSGWKVTTIASRPEGFGGTESGEVAALRVGATFGAALLGATASHIVDSRLGARRLDAISGDFELPLPLGSTIGGELAGRRYATGEDFGMRAELRRRGARTSFRLRVSHAPGGSAAFARAADDFSAHLSQLVGSRIVLNASAWGSRDSSVSWSRFASEGWSLGPSIRLSRSVVLGLGANGSRLSAIGDAGAMASDEMSLASSLHVGWGPFYAAGGASTSALTRDDVLGSGTRFRSTASRGSLRGNVGVAGWLGRFELGVTGERSGQGVGLPVRQATYRARLSDFRINPGRRAILAEAAVDRLDWFGDRPPVHVVALGVNGVLPLGFRVRIGAERNPYMSSLTEENRWAFGLRVERVTAVPRLHRGGEDGILYRDLNANGTRDRHDPGVAGIIVRRHTDVAVTDRDGRFRFEGNHSAAITVDTRSLPPGLLVPAVGSSDTTRRREIGLVAIAAVRVRLVLADSMQTRVAASELGKVVVFARDADKRIWTARGVRSGEALFEALPAGRYTIGVDVSGSAEPLRVVGELPQLEIADGRDVPAVTITLQARRMRVRQMSAAGERP